MDINRKTAKTKYSGPINMTECHHANLLIVTSNSNRLRCRHCHLTLKTEELDGGYCPECLVVSGRKRDEFEKIESGENKVQYRCEDCGALLDPVGN